MRYLNHAGTSFPKPASVHQAAAEALSAHPREQTELYRVAFSKLKAEFRAAGKSDPFRVVAASGCTSALALALGDVPWEPGGVLVTSSYEHHALDRVAQALEINRNIVRVSVKPSSGEAFDLDIFTQLLSEQKVRLVALTHVSNVTGEPLPLRQIARQLRGRGIPLLIDAAQTFGTPLFDDAVRYGDIIVAAGHKSALGPQGIGVLAARASVNFRVPGAACELGERACGTFPGFCDVGSVNIAGLCGLAAGLGWSKRAGREALWRRAGELGAQLRQFLSENPRFELLGPATHEGAATASFVPKETALEDVAPRLASRGLILRVGTHCAPQALGTLGYPEGCARASFGPLSTTDDLEALLDALGEF